MDARIAIVLELVLGEDVEGDEPVLFRTAGSVVTSV
jgi:hypothetical protein